MIDVIETCCVDGCDNTGHWLLKFWYPKTREFREKVYCQSHGEYEVQSVNEHFLLGIPIDRELHGLRLCTVEQAIQHNAMKRKEKAQREAAAIHETDQH